MQFDPRSASSTELNETFEASGNGTTDPNPKQETTTNYEPLPIDPTPRWL